MAAAKSFLEKQIKMRLRLSLYSYLLMWEIFRLAHHHRSKSNLKNKIIFVLLYLSSSDGDRRRAVRDPGCSTCTPDLHSPEPSRHHVALCISMNFYILAIKPLIWSGMMFCVWLESIHPSREWPGWEVNFPSQRPRLELEKRVCNLGQRWFLQ